MGGGAGASPALSWRVFATFLGHWELQGTGPHVLVSPAHGGPIGLAGPWYPRGWPERELTWSLWHAAFEGQGLAREAVRALRDHVYGPLGWTRAVSYVHPENTASIALCRSLGCIEDPTLPAPDDDPTHIFVYPKPPRP